MTAKAYLPEVYFGPLRLGAHRETLDALFEEPLLLAAHYAAIASTVRWPEDIAQAIARIEEEYQSHDAVLKLIDSVRSQINMALSVSLARRIAVGLELHTLLANDHRTYRQACETGLALIQPLQTTSPASERLADLVALLEFSPAERQLLTLALAHGLVPALPLLNRLAAEQRWLRAKFWQILLDLDARSLAAALSSRSRLAGSGIVSLQQGLPTLSEFWIELLLNLEVDFETGLLQLLVVRDSADGASRLPGEERAVLSALLQSKETGINVLLHGKPALDKQSLARRLVEEAQGVAHTLVPDIPEADLTAAVMLAQRLLATHAGHPVLVVEKAPQILTRVLPQGFSFFGLFDDDEREARPIDERLLAENPVPTLWLAHDARRLHADTMARFLFHAEAQKASRADRRVLVEATIASLPVDAWHKGELAKFEGLSEQQLASARRVAQLTAGRSRKTFARHLLLAATRSQKALARKDKDGARIPVTRYSLDYLNCAGRFGPSQILKALKLRPSGSLCLYGLPGTGKTQFAEHLALELGRPLLIRPASALFDKYVGESEKRIAEAFDQAEEEDAVLLLDEADSFLRDRTRSQQQWEVSTVNELLQRMERYEGVFVCSTNLYQQIDVAALRRFTFKLEFLPLLVHQRWEMFLNETGLRNKKLSEAQQSAFEERLALMKDLTPGDFATVKRQCVLLGESLSPKEWLDQLELEVAAKLGRNSEETRERRFA